MHYIRVAAIAVEFSIRLFHRGIITGVLERKHVDEATELLSQEFCRREPLCRVLGLNLEDIRGFFREHVQHVADQKLGIVACNLKGKVLGVVSIEDYFSRYEPSGVGLHPGLQAIGHYLDSISLPADILPERPGELYHCALAAVGKGKGQSQVLSLMILEVYSQLKKKGYKGGYAKVTNPGIIKRFKRLEKYAFTQVFQPKLFAHPAAFELNGEKPFGSYEGATSLYCWPMY